MLTPFGFLFLAAALVGPSSTAKLTSGDTTVTLEATTSAPLLSMLAVKGFPGWENHAPETLIDHVEIGGQTRHLNWEFRAGDSSASASRVLFVYDSRDPHLRLYWEWRVRGVRGPIEHSIRIQNLSGAEMWLPLQASFQFDFQVAANERVDQFWVEKGASSPSVEGTHTVALKDGYEWTGTSSTYAHPPKGAPREIIPYLLVERADAAQSGWYAGIEFSGRTRMTLRRNDDSIAGEVGLNPDSSGYRTRLFPNETFETPTVFLGGCRGGPDGAGNVLRRWIRDVLNNPATIRNPTYPTLVSNSWGSGMAINEDQAHQMIDDASDLGLEMFHLDAGWFRNVGDWVSNPDKFPHGVGSIADYAHRLGLKFGLWTDWTQAGIGTGPEALNVHDPKVRDWLTLDPPIGWSPEEFKGITIDIGVPAARQCATATVGKIVSDFHLDMLEHDGYLVAQGCERQDHAHAPLDSATAKRYKDEGFLWVSGSNDTDVSYRATRAYYEVQTELRRRFSHLLFEICNDGGRMVDFGSAAHGDYFSVSDGYDPLSNRRAFFDASHVLPPAMIESYVEKWPTANIDNFRYMLRSGMMGWFSLMMDPRSWTTQQREVARAEFALYKQKLRPLIRNADLYHDPARPDGIHWDGVEYFDSATRRGVLFAFRGSTESENSHVFKIRGVLKTGQYRVTFQDGSSGSYVASGAQLGAVGITVRQQMPNSSELVFLEEESLHPVRRIP